MAARAGLSGIEFGVSIPGHGRRRRADERQRLRRCAGRRARVGRGRQRRRNRAAHARRSSASPIGARTSSPGRSSPSAVFRLRAASADQVKAALADLRERRKQAQPAGIKTFGSTFKNPGIRSAGGSHRRPAARCGRLPRAAGRRRGLQRQARQLRREPRRCDDGRGGRADGPGTPPGQRAIRGRARARGPAARARSRCPATGSADDRRAAPGRDAAGAGCGRAAAAAAGLASSTGCAPGSARAAAILWWRFSVVSRSSSLVAIHQVRVTGLSGPNVGPDRHAR